MLAFAEAVILVSFISTIGAMQIFTPSLIFSMDASEYSITSLYKASQKLDVPNTLNLDTYVDRKEPKIPNQLKPFYLDTLKSAKKVKDYEPSSLFMEIGTVSLSISIPWDDDKSNYQILYNNLLIDLEELTEESFYLLNNDMKRLDYVGADIIGIYDSASYYYYSLEQIFSIYDACYENELKCNEKDMEERAFILCYMCELKENDDISVKRAVNMYNEMLSPNQLDSFFDKVIILHNAANESLKKMTLSYENSRKNLEKKIGNFDENNRIESEELHFITDEVNEKIFNLNLKTTKCINSCKPISETVSKIKEDFNYIKEKIISVETDFPIEDDYLGNRLIRLSHIESRFNSTKILEGDTIQYLEETNKLLKERYSRNFEIAKEKGLFKSIYYDNAEEYSKFEGSLGGSIVNYIEGIEYIQNLIGRMNQTDFLTIEEKKERIEYLLISLGDLEKNFVKDKRKDFEGILKIDIIKDYSLLVFELSNLEIELEEKAYSHFYRIDSLKNKSNLLVFSLDIMLEKGININKQDISSLKKDYFDATNLVYVYNVANLFKKYNTIINKAEKTIYNHEKEFISKEIRINTFIEKNCENNLALISIEFENSLYVSLGPLAIDISLYEGITGKNVNNGKLSFIIPQIKPGKTYLETFELQHTSNCEEEIKIIQDSTAQIETIKVENIFSSREDAEKLNKIRNKISDICYFEDCSDLLEDYDKEREKWLENKPINEGNIEKKIDEKGKNLINSLKKAFDEQEVNSISERYMRALGSSENNSKHFDIYEKYKEYVQILSKPNLATILEGNTASSIVSKRKEIEAIILKANETIYGLKSRAMNRIRESAEMLKEDPENEILLAKINEAGELFEKGYYTKVVEKLKDVNQVTFTVSSVKPEHLVVPFLVIGTTLLILKKPKKKAIKNKACLKSY